METGRMTGVSRTAIGVAALRARENSRPDALFTDSYAEAFLAEATAAIPEYGVDPVNKPSPTMALFGRLIVLRTRFYDDYLLAAVAAGCRQVVLLAVGLDTRAFRLAWPDGVHLFELDLPELLDYKERVLADRRAVPRCRRTVLRVDLRGDWPARLVEAGLRPDERTAWLVEGLLAYLSFDEAAGLLTEVGRLSAPGSQISCEDRDSPVDNPTLEAMLADPVIAEVVTLLKGGLGDDKVGWLQRNDWRVNVHDGADLAESYQRPDPEMANFGFLTAVREGPRAVTT